MMITQMVASLLIAQSSTAIATCDRLAFIAEQQEKRQALRGKLTSLLARSRSISAQRQVIAERLTELAEGRHRLKGVIDPNYDDDALRGRDRALASQLDIIQREGLFIQAEVDLLKFDAESFAVACEDLAAND